MKIKDYTLGTFKPTDKITVSDGDTGETKNVMASELSNYGYTETTLSISAADFLAGYQNGIEIFAAPAAGTYLDWYAIIEKNDDGSFNITSTDQIYVGPSDFRGGQLIGDLGFANNNANKIAAFVRPNITYVSTSFTTSSFQTIEQGLIIASWTGIAPNDATCSFNVKLYTKEINHGL